MCTDALFSWVSGLQFFNIHLSHSQLQSFNPDKLTGGEWQNLLIWNCILINVPNGYFYNHLLLSVLPCPHDFSGNGLVNTDMPIISPTSSRCSHEEIIYSLTFYLFFSICALNSFQFQDVRHLTDWYFCHLMPARLKTWSLISVIKIIYTGSQRFLFKLQSIASSYILQN